MTNGNPRTTLAHFRAAHPVVPVRVDAEVWEYVVGGEGVPAVLIVPGGGGTAESMFNVNLAIEPSHRTLSVTVPAGIEDRDSLVKGLEAVLDHAGIGRAVLLGHSFGGAVVEVFAAARPERTQGLILSHFAHYLGFRRYLLPRLSALFSRLPDRRLIGLVERRLGDLVAGTEDPEFWIAFMKEELAASKAVGRLKAHFRLLGKLSRAFEPAGPASLADKPVQILAAADDSGFTEREHEALVAHYSGAHVAMMPEGAGHLSFVTRPAAYLNVVRSFLEGL